MIAHKCKLILPKSLLNISIGHDFDIKSGPWRLPEKNLKNEKKLKNQFKKTNVFGKIVQFKNKNWLWRKSGKSNPFLDKFLKQKNEKYLGNSRQTNIQGFDKI